MPSTTTIHFVPLPRLVFPTPASLFSREQNSRPETTRSTSTAGAGLTRSETREDYGINNVIGDQYYCDVIREQLLHLGINYEISVFGPNTRARIFANFKHLLVQGKIELLGNAEPLLQLRNLREEKTDRGQIDVRPGGERKTIWQSRWLQATLEATVPSGSFFDADRRTTTSSEPDELLVASDLPEFSMLYGRRSLPKLCGSMTYRITGVPTSGTKLTLFDFMTSAGAWQGLMPHIWHADPRAD